MKKAISFLVSLILCHVGVATTEAAQLDAEGDWIYLVKTEPSEPAREAEFNTWYEEIDIPDVLAVSSFRRARRAVWQPVPEFPDVRAKEGDGTHVALYDMASSDIDKSIIDLYVAARKMNALGRSTDALRVVEANYYRRLAGYRLRSANLGADKYFLIQKIICCQTESDVAEYQDWFSNELMPQLARDSQMVETGLFVLYRVMEELAVSEDEMPHLLAVFEIGSPSAVDVLTGVDDVLGGFQYSGKPGNTHEVRDSILYRQTSDARSD